MKNKEFKMKMQIERANLLKNLHIKGNPLILFNIWDAGSARAIQEVGAKVIATGSWSVATAHGYDDGEKLPFDLVLANIQRIIESIDIPVTIDFEGNPRIVYLSKLNNPFLLLNMFRYRTFIDLISSS